MSETHSHCQLASCFVLSKDNQIDARLVSLLHSSSPTEQFYLSILSFKYIASVSQAFLFDHALVYL